MSRERSSPPSMILVFRTPRDAMPGESPDENVQVSLLIMNASLRRRLFLSLSLLLRRRNPTYFFFLSSDLFSLKQESSIFRSVVQP